MIFLSEEVSRRFLNPLIIQATGNFDQLAFHTFFSPLLFLLHPWQFSFLQHLFVQDRVYISDCLSFR
jgi:hypothetical protein